MKFDKIYAVSSTGELCEENSSDVLFFARRILKSQFCASYSYDDYEIVDEDGNVIEYSYGSYKVLRIWTSGFAENYALSITVVDGNGEEYTQSFYNDIRYGFDPSLFLIQKREWRMENPFTDVVELLSDLSKYGVAACKRIIELRREIYDMKVQNEYSDDKLKRTSHILCNVEELVFAEGVTELLEREFECLSLRAGIKRLVLPSTLESIGLCSFKGLDSLETIICKAVTPPSHFWAGFYRAYNKSFKTVYVPSESVEEYKKAWGESIGDCHFEILPLED